MELVACKLPRVTSPYCYILDSLGFITGPCSIDEFLCFSSGECIPTANVCDHEPHCTDGSDEEDCYNGPGITQTLSATWELLSQLQWLPIQQRNVFKIALKISSNVYNNIPPQYPNHCIHPCMYQIGRLDRLHAIIQASSI